MKNEPINPFLKFFDLNAQSKLNEYAEKMKNCGVPEKHIRSTHLAVDKLALDYGWVSEWEHLTPREMDDLLDIWSKTNDSKNEQEELISKYFIEFYSNSDFYWLDELVESWESNPILKRRLPIIRDCIFALKNASSQFNPSNLVIPVLISQIDGVIGELIERDGAQCTETVTKNGKKRKHWIFCKDGRQVGPVNASEKVFGHLIKDKRNSLGEFKGKYSFSQLIQTNSRYDVILEGLFQPSIHGEKPDNPSFISRHKILHGEDIEYGTLKNAIKLFLIMNYLSQFKLSKLADPDDSELVEFRTLQSVWDEAKNEDTFPFSSSRGFPHRKD